MRTKRFSGAAALAATAAGGGFVAPAGASLLTWLPDASQVYRDVAFRATEEDTRVFLSPTEFQGMKYHWKPDAPDSWLDTAFWVAWTGRHWDVPTVAVAVYFIGIAVLRRIVAANGRWNVRNVAFYWNLSLSLFSCFGVAASAPVLLHELATNGLYFTCCAQAAWYGEGAHGLFVALFVYSKVFELFDTILLVLADKPVIALQWWHHSTVLLYCWHSYACRIGTGMWFTVMNYSVHAVMYGYFAATATRYRKTVSPYAIFITLAQLAQMVVGIFVTVKAVLYQDAGLECHVNKTNSVLGLLMYCSYFVLFLKLYIDNYVTKSRKRVHADEGFSANPQEASPGPSTSCAGSHPARAAVDSWLAKAYSVFGAPHRSALFPGRAKEV